MNPREDIFRKMRNALGKNSTIPMEDVKDILAKISFPAESDIVQKFIKRVEEAGGIPVPLRDFAEFKEWIKTFCEEERIRSIVISSHPVFVQNSLRPFLEEKLANVDLWEYPAEEISEETLDALKTCVASTNVGIGTALGGFADSGAVAIETSSYESRSLSLLPETHIVVLSEDAIYPSLNHFSPEIPSLIRDRKRSAITLIGGPSKTADIEKVLVTGVHGPKKFVVAVLKNFGGKDTE